MGPKGKAVKNLLGVTLSFTTVFGPYIGILAIQSSVNSNQGLGLAGAAISYAFKALAVPVIPVLYSRIGSKYSGIIGYTLFLLYAACNYYPSWYTLVPGNIIMGAALNLMFVSSLTHTSETASLYASSLGKNYEHTVALFLSLFSAAIKGGNILGSLVSSSVLFNLDYNETDDIILSDEPDKSQCNNMGASSVEKDYLYYVLISVYVLLGLIGITLASTLLDNFKVDYKFQSLSVCFDQQVKHVLVGLLKMLINYKMLLMFPLFMVNGMSIGFITGSFSKVFVSDCIGVEWIGFIITVYSVIGLVMGILFGWLRRWVSSLALILMSTIVAEGLILFLLFWSREPSYYAVFGFAVGWGICDGVWQSVVTGVVGFIFAETKQVAFTVYELGLSAGFVIAFLSGIIFPITTHLWIMFSIVLYAGISYTTLVIVMKISGKHKGDEVQSTENRKRVHDSQTSSQTSERESGKVDDTSSNKSTGSTDSVPKQIVLMYYVYSESTV